MRGRRNKRRLAYIRKVYKNDPEVWVRVASVFLGLNVPIPGFRSAERQVAKAIEDAPDRMRGSALIPWLARETSRELKRFRALRRPVPPLPIPSAPENTTVALFTLQEPRKLADVIDWYSAPDGGAGTDLGKMSWLEALNKAEAWHEAMLKTEGRRLGAADQGSVTYRWSDGWTAQFLDTPELLEAEGEAMQNCIADYWDEVDRGDSVIVSLRNPRGQPRVTIQITQDLDKTWAAEGNLREVLQAEGRGQTQPPAPKYRARLKDLFGSLIGEDPQEWGDAGLAATHSDQEMWTLFREGHIADHQSLLGWVRTGLTAAQHAASRDLGWSDYPIPVWAQLPTGDDTLHTLQWKLQPSYITRPMLAAYVGKRLRSRLTPQGREFVDWRLDLHDAAPHELLGTLHGYRELDRFMFGPDRQLVGARSILGNLDKKVRKHLRDLDSRTVVAQIRLPSKPTEEGIRRAYKRARLALERGIRKELTRLNVGGYGYPPRVMSNWLEIYGNKARKATAAGRIPQFAPWQLKMGPLRWTLEEFDPETGEAVLDLVVRRTNKSGKEFVRHQERK